MKVLITGSEGYIGALMRDVLIERGHEVHGIDTGFFNEGDFHRKPTPIPVLKRDMRQLEVSDLAGFDAICHLAALSNDPLGNLDPSLTVDINTRASIRLAELAREAGVQRFLFSSSCSMYGQGESMALTEDANFNPVTEYARSKVAVESAVRELASDDFSPTYFRNATAFGLSPRLRFDLVVNSLTGWAFTAGAIRMTSDGTPWRPLVHIHDISRAFACALEAPLESIHNKAFNVGRNAFNYQIRQVAEMVQEFFPDCELSFGSSDGDARTYNVDFSRIERELPGFGHAKIDVRQGIAELKEACEQIALTDEAFHGRLYTRLMQINYLRETGAIDDRLFWTQ